MGWFLMAYLHFDRLAGEGKEVSGCCQIHPWLFLTDDGLGSGSYKDTALYLQYPSSAQEAYPP